MTYLNRLQESLTASIPEIPPNREVVEVMRPFKLLRRLSERCELFWGNPIRAFSPQVVLRARLLSRVSFTPKWMRRDIRALRFESVVEAAIGLRRNHEV